MSRLIRRSLTLALISAAATMLCSAQYNHPKRTLNDGMTGQLVKTGLYVISGQGSNSVVRLSANGVILVDGKRAGNYDGLLAHIRQVVDQPTRALILTSCSASGTGTNLKFFEDGTRIVVQEHARQDSPACNLPSDQGPSPVLTYATDHKIHLGGVEVQVMHFGNAYSRSDTVVYFPDLKVVALGNLVSPSPMPDFSSGGSLLEWGPVLEQVLKLDFDTAVPSSGPPMTKAEVQAYKLKIDTLTSRAKKLVAQGVPREQFMESLKVDDLGWQLNYDAAQLDSLYAEMSKPDASTHEAHLNGKTLPPR